MILFMSQDTLNFDMVADSLVHHNIYREFVDSVVDYIGTQNFTLIVILLIVNLLATLVNIFLPIWIKNKEKKIFSFQHKEKMRIDLCTEVYATMWTIRTYCLFPDETQIVEDAKKTLRAHMTIRSLYLDKEKIVVIKDFLDWTNGAELDVKICDNLMAEFKKLAA